MHSFKKGQQILAVSQKGGEVRAYSREKMSDRITPDSFFSDTHAFVAPQPVRFFFLFLRRIRASYYKMYSITHSAQTKKLPLSECFFERVFRPLLVTQLFHGRKKREKIFSLFCVQASQDAFLYQNSSEVLTCLYIIHILSRSDYYYYDFNR